TSLDRLRGGLLQVRVKRGVDAVGLVIQLVFVQLRDQLIANQVDKVRSIAGLNVRRRQIQLGGFGFVRFGTSDAVGLNHGIEHKVPPVQRSLRMPVRRKRARRLNNAGNQCRFGQTNVSQILVEVCARGLREAAEG